MKFTIEKTHINYLKGDASIPLKSNTAIIHVCNDVGAWGAGFVLALSKHYNKNHGTSPEYAYKNIFLRELGTIQIIGIDYALTNKHNCFVINMIAQHGIGLGNPFPPIRYTALSSCLNQVHMQLPLDISIQAPKFGSGLAGGNWNVIEQMIWEVFCENPKDRREVNILTP